MIAEDRNMKKLEEDRDLAMKLCASMSNKLEILEKHVCILEGRLALKNSLLSKEELKTLSEVLEVYGR